MFRIGVKQATKDGYIEMQNGGVCDLLYPSSTFRRGRVQGGGKISPTIQTTSGVCRVMLDDYLYKDFGVFKLSPTECLRLMNVRDEDISKMMEINSATQCYKQAGNSIVVAVLMAIFSQLNIKGVKTWNEMSDEERYEVIYRGCEVK